MDPLTVITIAQTGMQLYGMFRSSGGGIGGLLAAQTQMLVEISQHISVINGRLKHIYDKLEDIKELVLDLPKKNAIEALNMALEGYFIRSKELLETYFKYENSNGRPYAVMKVQKEANELLGKLSSARSSLIGDKSEALCPIVTASWYIELQLRGYCIPFDGKRIHSAARTYDEVLDLWLSKVTNILEETGREIKSIFDSSTQTQGYAGHICNHSPEVKENEVKERSGGGYTTIVIYQMLTAKKSQLIAEPSPIREHLPLYRTALETLAAADVNINPQYAEAYQRIAPLQWAVKTMPRYLVYGARTKEILKREMETLRKTECPQSDFAQKFAEQQNVIATDTEKLFLKTLLYGHYLLVCREAKKSVRSVIKSVERSA